MCYFFRKNEKDSFIASLQICGLENLKLQHAVLGNQICCVGKLSQDQHHKPNKISVENHLLSLSELSSAA